MSFQLVIIGGVIGSIVVASVAEGYVLKGAASLPPDARERIYQRMARVEMYWRILDGLGAAFMILGFLGMFGVIRGGPDFAWRTGAMALGIVLLCLERTIRSWATYGAYRQEGEATAVWEKARTAAILVSLVELALAGAVCWFVFTQVTYIGPRGRKPSGANTPATKGEAEEKPAAARTWISEEEALKILGKDKTYLDLVVPHQQIRTKTVEGRTYYRQDDLTSVKEAGLPTLDELQQNR